MDEKDISPSEEQEGNVIFLGYCERAVLLPEANCFKWNLLGLKQVVFSQIYPMPLRGDGFLGFAFLGSPEFSNCRFQMTSEAGEEVGWLNLEAQSAPAVEKSQELATNNIPKFLMLPNVWTPLFLSLRSFDFVIKEPGIYKINLRTPSGLRTIGRIHFGLATPSPLTPDRIAAIRSDPNSAKAIKMVLGCKNCQSKYKVYAALERSKKIEGEEGFKWYQECDESFSCVCGKTNMDLKIIKSNLHGFLGQKKSASDDLKFVPLYERSSLEHIRDKYLSVIESSSSEEEVQKFLEKNTVLFHQFPAERLFPKPKILTDFVADFAIVTPDRKLILIELEKPSTRLLKKSGGIHSELSHAFDQVRDWLHKVSEHRLAVLDSLKIDREQVSAIRGVVIAGRDAGYDKRHLHKMKGVNYGENIDFFTYDDLGAALDTLIRQI